MKNSLNQKGNFPSEEEYHKISLSLPNAPEYVSVVRLTLSGIANRMGFDIEAIEDLKVAVAEACTNAITHGCGDCNYTIEFSILKDRLQIEISDKGRGFDYNLIQEPDLSQPREGGLGIFIIKSLMDEVKFFKNNNCGTKIIMSKKLGDA
ncbi:ATP-binding protein [Garciella nitratireducens]|uniref:ATP-binding protein n=1 Tax=Garciella nitratireducens TaxID=218205 RepID=UPI000DEB2D91|nr:ATP-binding protein [Garciella nitratireducens]RBP42874.1 serine/threonine-protein kinase RsbW [Garciella nitratireducens]